VIILPLFLALLVVGVVYVTRRHRQRALSAGPAAGTMPNAGAMTPAGSASLVVLAAAVVLWALTRTTLPIYFTAALGGVAFVLAVVAGAVQHDRSPLLLLPLLAVPLALAASLAFVLLQ
jgi:hypothetical protein